MAYIGKSPTGTGVRSRYYYTATGGETSLSGADDNSNTLVFSDGNYVDVSLNGIALVAGTDYNTSTANTIAGLSALSASDIVEIVVYDIFTVADTVSAKDGGTFSGNVAMGGTLSVTGASTATGGLNVGTIKEATGTTTAMTIDSIGRILTPARPVFRATGPTPSAVTNQNYTTATKLTFWDNEMFDVGSNFDAGTNYRFTAPITGYYQFNCNVQFRDLASGQAYLFFYKNGSAYTGARGEAKTDATIDRWQLNLNDVIQLDSTDYVEVYMQSSGDTSLDFVVNESSFSGFLIG